MTDHLLTDLVDLAYKHASQQIIPTTKELLACFLLLKKDNQFDVIGCPWKDDQDKRKTILAIGMKVIKDPEPVIAYSMLSECWTSHYNKDEPKRADRPEHDPKRREAIVCLASNGKERIGRGWVINRDSQGRCVSLTSQPEGLGFESWMLDAIDKAMEVRAIKDKMMEDFRDERAT
jgi:hypothetical protein